MADSQFYGIDPRGHHLTSVIIHTISSLLLLLLLFRLTGALWPSSFVAAFFALHPLHVESVAWVAERKDVLSAFFCFLTLLLYSEYVAKRKLTMYMLSLFSFVLGLMSKPMLVTLPLVMLLIDFWPLDRYLHDAREQGSCPLSKRVLALIIEKSPFLACSFLSGVATIYAQHKGGAVRSLDAIPLMLRIENTLIAYVKYIGKTLLPYDLALVYPISFSIPLWQVVCSLLVLLVISVAAVRSRRRNPYLMVGWFWFLVTLVPVIGLIQVGVQSMADRYSYIPGIGLFIMAAWGVPDLTKGLQHRQVILALLACLLITASAALTWHQLGYWRDSISLYRHTLDVTTGNYLIRDHLGQVLAERGDLDAAIKEYREAIRINPNAMHSHYNLGIALFTKGNLDAAIREFQEALRLNPASRDAHVNLGAALVSKGNLDGAIQEFQEAIRINPNFADAHNNLGTALEGKGQLDAAIREYQEALRLNPDYRDAHINLGAALARKKM
jgi:tetratricopeptide (TPR) repeat protein